jgi:hypothetical protein
MCEPQMSQNQNKGEGWVTMAKKFLIPEAKQHFPGKNKNPIL